MPDTVKKNPVLRYMIGDYLKVNSVFELMSVFNAIDENPGANTKTTHYTANKSASTETIGYTPQFQITGDMYRGEVTSEYLTDIGQEQKLGADIRTEYVRVDLERPTETTDEYYARLFVISVEISGFAGAGGENVVITGNLNPVEDAKIGTFNTESLTFTEKPKIPASVYY